MVKSPLFGPPTATEEMWSVAAPELVTVTVFGPVVVPCVIAPKETLVVDRETAGVVDGAEVAFPLTGIICGEFGASSVMVMIAERWPAATGVNVNVSEQPALAASALAVQPLVMVKSPGLLPLRVTEEMWSVALPEFVSMAMIGLLGVPCTVVGKATGFGVTGTAGAGGGGATPAPLSCTD